MRGRPFAIEGQAADTPEALKAAYQAERDGPIRTRLHALWLLRSGWALGPVAQVVGAHYRSVQRWVGWYRVGGRAAVRAHQLGGTGQAPFLSAAQQEEVASEVASGRFRTGEEIRAWIKERFGVDYTLAGVYGLLKRLRCGPKVPRPIHAKADPAAQAAWKKGGSSEPSVRLA